MVQLWDAATGQGLQAINAQFFSPTLSFFISSVSPFSLQDRCGRPLCWLANDFSIKYCLFSPDERSVVIATTRKQVLTIDLSSIRQETGDIRNQHPLSQQNSPFIPSLSPSSHHREMGFWHQRAIGWICSRMLCILYMKNLYVSKEFGPGIVSTLPELVEDQTTEILPIPQNIFLEGRRLSGHIQKHIEQFIAARDSSPGTR